jgi:hypothetical protein
MCRHPCKCGAPNCTGFLGSFRQESTQRGGTKNAASASLSKKTPNTARKPARSSETRPPTCTGGNSDSDVELEQNVTVQSHCSARDAVKAARATPAKSRGQNAAEKRMPPQHHSRADTDDACLTAESRNKRVRTAAGEDDSPAGRGSPGQNRLLAGSNSARKVVKSVGGVGNKNVDSESELNRTAPPRSLDGRTGNGRATGDRTLDSESARKRAKGLSAADDAEAVYASRKALVAR